MRSLSDEARRVIALFEEQTGATVRDCVVDERFDRVLVVVGAGEMGQAIGPGGDHVERVSDRLDRPVKVVEYAPLVEDFVANALAPAAVYNVTMSENDSTVAYVEVAEEDRGVAIGADGRTIAAARRLADRLYDVDDVELT